jgi:hypothetical protein
MHEMHHISTTLKNSAWAASARTGASGTRFLVCLFNNNKNYY